MSREFRLLNSSAKTPSFSSEMKQESTLVEKILRALASSASFDIIKIC